MRYLNKFNESVGDNFYYHYTDPHNIFNILNTNTFNLSSNLGNKNSNDKNYFYMAMSRSPNAKLGFARMNNSRIVFKKNDLKAKYKVLPTDDWGDLGGKNPEKYPSYGKKLSDLSYEMNLRVEYEDRLVSDKPKIVNINKYIERIDLLIHDWHENTNVFIYKIYALCKELGIKAFVYKNADDMSYGKNALKDNTDSLEYDYDEEDYKIKENNNFDFISLVALIMYDKSYMENDNYDKCLSDIEKYCKDNNIPIQRPYSVYDKMRDLYNGLDNSLINLRADISNFFKTGKSGLIRDKINLLTNEFKKCGVKTIQELYECKFLGKLPKNSPKKDWSAKYQFAQWHKIYGDNSEEDKIEYIPIPNDTLFKDLRGFYYYSTGYSGQFTIEEFDKLKDMDTEGKPISSVINYLFNKYTPNIAIEKIEKSSWDSYDKVYRYKIIKIK